MIERLCTRGRDVMCTLQGVCAGVARRTLRLGKAW